MSQAGAFELRMRSAEAAIGRGVIPSAFGYLRCLRRWAEPDNGNRYYVNPAARKGTATWCGAGESGAPPSIDATVAQYRPSQPASEARGRGTFNQGTP